MNLQRWILLIGTAILGALTYAVQSDTFPKWTLLLGLGVVFLTHLIQGLTQAVQIPPSSPASKVSSIRPPLPMLFLLALALPLGGCAWFATNKQALEPLEDDACVFGAVEAGMSPDAAAGFCHVAVDYVNSLLAKKASHKAAAIAARDAGADAVKP